MDENYYTFMEWELNGSFNYLENLPLGKYYLKEISPGTGYTLNDEIYEFEFNEEKDFHFAGLRFGSCIDRRLRQQTGGGQDRRGRGNPDSGSR